MGRKGLLGGKNQLQCKQALRDMGTKGLDGAVALDFKGGFGFAIGTDTSPPALTPTFSKRGEE